MLNKAEKAVEQYKLDQEKAVLKKLELHYEYALNGINERLQVLQAAPETQSKVYQKQYQKTLKKQVSAILENLRANEYATLDQYMHDAYTTGFVGTMYDLHHQGVPLLIPINQSAILKAVQHDTKLTHPLYDELGIDTKRMSRFISREISRGIASGLAYDEVARNIKNVTKAPLSRAKVIARTEGHRIQQASSQDAAEAAKAKGADIVKQWDSTLDGDTRPNHRQLDGQIRELDKPFEVGTYAPMYPGDFGDPGEDCNCRCVSLKRARAALGEDELKTLRERAIRHSLYVDDPKAFRQGKLPALKSYEEFQKSYLKAAETINGNVALQATPSPVYQSIIQSGGKVMHIGGVDCVVHEEDYGFTDGTGIGIKKTVKAKIYTMPDGTQFVYPKSYDKKKQTLSPEEAISIWNRVPQNIRDKIQKKIEVVDYYNPQDSYWRKKYKNFTHSYATGGDTITFYRSNSHDPDYVAKTFCHEGGHYIDYTLPGTSRISRFSEQQDWQNAMANDLKTSGKKSWRAYGENSPLEDFADSVAYYVFEHASFAATFPERTKLLNTILK